MDVMITRRGGAGAGLNFTVTGGTMPPGSPKENTIWVNTDQEITGWSFSATEPTEPVEGMVWFKMDTNSSGSFNALLQNDLIVYPGQSFQYQSDEWVECDAKICQAGTWTDLFSATYLYNKGYEYSNLTGGWIAEARQYINNNASVQPSVRRGEESIVVTFNGTGGRGGVFRTGRAINLTDYKELHFHGKMSRAVDNTNYFRFCAWSSIGSEWGQNIVLSYYSDLSKEITEFVVDVSKLGNVYVGFGLYGGSLSVEMEQMYVK